MRKRKMKNFYLWEKVNYVFGNPRYRIFFREFSSESRRILFLGQILDVFSTGNSGLTIFQG